MGRSDVAVVAVQLQEVAKDVARLEHEMAEHRKDHEREVRARLQSRRWLIGIAVAVLAAVEGPLIGVLLHVHG